VLIVCEGYLDTTYFNALQRHPNVRTRYKPETHCAGGGGHAKVVEEAEKRAKNCTKGTPIWCIFDVEHNPQCPSLKKSLERCAQKKFYVGLSNPCFNVWAIAHRQNIQTGFLTVAGSLRDLKSLCGDKLDVHNSDWVLEQILGGDAFPNINSALANIAHFTSNQTSQILTKNPSTSVGELVQVLIGI
jgi:hypothetical protein